MNETLYEFHCDNGSIFITRHIVGEMSYTVLSDQTKNTCEIVRADDLSRKINEYKVKEADYI